MIRSKVSPAREAAVAVGSVLIFIWLARLASSAAAPEFDLAWCETVHSFANPVLTWLMKAASLAGSGYFLWPVAALTVGLLVSAARVRDAVLFVIAVIGANLITETLKLFFHRARPSPLYGYQLPSTFSFPSGHAFVSFCFYLCLAEILIRDAWPLARKILVWSAAIACTLTIGISRVYLGVHYPTDVLAGYTAAIAWTTLIRVAHHMWLGKRKRRQEKLNGEGNFEEGYGQQKMR